MQLGDLITLTISDIARSGSGIAKAESGQVVFVPFTAPGDVVEVRIEEVEKRYCMGRVETILQASPQRIEPKCPVFTRCGGCEWQHLPYDVQWSTKVKGLRHALERMQLEFKGAIEEIPAEQIWHYRNRVQMRGFAAEIGFFGRGSKDLVAVESCPIARPEINVGITEARREGAGRPKPYKVELALDEKGVLQKLWNAPHSAGGFRQVHDGQNEKLKNWVSSHVTDSALVWDLYGGRGNLSLGLSTRVKEIHCVDIGAYRELPAGLPANFFSYQEEVHEWVGKVARPLMAPTVIMDPPRDGLGVKGKFILEKLAKLGASRMIFVGCDVDNWVRDVSRAVGLGWKVTHLGALDLFPQTHHLETLAVVERAPT